jgi:hypothetical protein
VRHFLTGGQRTSNILLVSLEMIWSVSATYPFEPVSNRYLVPGQYWAIPLTDGRFACGRVLAVPAYEQSRVLAVVGLMDWVGARPPNDGDLAGRKIVRFGLAHVKAINQNGGAILGLRPLALDGIEAPEIVDIDAVILENRMPSWGFGVIRRMAERRFVKGQTTRPAN